MIHQPRNAPVTKIGLEKPIVGDGVGRSLEQMKQFLAFAEAQDFLDQVRGVFVNVEIQAAIQQIQMRALLHPDKARRDDLDPQVIQRRIETYLSKTGPAIQHLKDLGMLITLDGNTDFDREGYSALLAERNELLKSGINPDRLHEVQAKIDEYNPQIEGSKAQVRGRMSNVLSEHGVFVSLPAHDIPQDTAYDATRSINA